MRCGEIPAVVESHTERKISKTLKKNMNDKESTVNLINDKCIQQASTLSTVVQNLRSYSLLQWNAPHPPSILMNKHRSALVET